MTRPPRTSRDVPWRALIWLGVALILLVSAVAVNMLFARRAERLTGIPAEFEVGRDAGGYYQRSPRLQARKPIAAEQYEQWLRNQNFRRLAVLPGLLALGALVLAWRNYERMV